MEAKEKSAAMEGWWKLPTICQKFEHAVILVLTLLISVIVLFFTAAARASFPSFSISSASFRNAFGSSARMFAPTAAPARRWAGAMPLSSARGRGPSGNGPAPRRWTCRVSAMQTTRRGRPRGPRTKPRALR